jgi:hypothetical protein
LGYWDIDFEDVNLLEQRITGTFDIVFYFSMSYHVGVVPWLSEVTREICIVEDNSKRRDAIDHLKSQFKEVTYVGEQNDREEPVGAGLKIYWCRP